MTYQSNHNPIQSQAVAMVQVSDAETMRQQSHISTFFLNDYEQALWTKSMADTSRHLTAHY